MTTVEWVADLPGRPSRQPNSEWIQERQDILNALAQKPGVWGRLKAYDDPKPARMATLRLKTEGFSFAVRATQTDEWSLFGRCNTPEQEADAEKLRKERRLSRRKQSENVTDSDDESEGDASEEKPPARKRRAS